MAPSTRSFLALALALSLLSACGEDEKPPVVSTQMEADMGDSDMEPQGDTGQPEEDLPEPLVPTGLEVLIEPGRAIYKPGLNLLPTARVYDQHGAPLEGAEVRWSVEPAEAAALQGTGRWRLMSEGPITFHGCAGEPAQEVCASKTVLSDQAGPRITIEAPLPGEQLSAEDGATLELRGQVTDTHGEVQLFFHGAQPVELGPDGSFSITVEPTPGVNHLELTATDGLQPADTVSAVDILWSRGYQPGPTEGVADLFLQDALTLHLGRRFLDDGQPLVVAEDQQEIIVQDLAGVLELLLQEVEVLSRLPDPVIDSDVVSLRLTSFRALDSTVEIRALEDGLEIFLRLGNVRLGTQGLFSLQGEEISLDGAIEATASAYIRVSLSKESREAPYVVDLTSLEVALEELRPRFLDGDANAVLDFAQSALRATVEQLLLDMVVQDFAQDVPGVLADALSSLDGALSGLSLPLDTGLSAPINLELDAGVYRVTTHPGEHIEANLEAAIRTGAPSLHPESRGVGLMHWPQAQAPFLSNKRLQIGGPMALLNGILHTLWDAGLMDIPVSDVLPPEIGFLILDANVVPRLPPVIRPRRPGDLDHDMILELGQFELHAQLAQQQDVYGFLVQVGADISLADGQLQVVISPDLTITIWVISSTGEEGARFTPDALRGAIVSQLLPLLTDLLAQSISVPLPVLEVNEITELAPGLDGLTLTPVQERPLQFRDGFFFFEGNLEGRSHRVTP